MSDRLVTLATFPSTAEAALARNVLEEGGIRCQLAQESSNWAFGGMIGNVTLLVFEGDVELAEQLLDDALGAPLAVEDEAQETDVEPPTSDFAENPPDRSPPLDVPAWTCTHCGVRVHQDDRVCWSCGASKKGEPNPYFVRSESTVAAPPAERTTSRSQDPEHVVATIDRAWRAACIGIILLPPVFNFYSMWLLLNAVNQATDLSPRYSHKFYLTLAINLIVTGMAVVIWTAILQA